MSMRNQPFNELSDGSAEALALLIEEAGEVIQAATKILRHGEYTYDPTVTGAQTNRQNLIKELGHMRCATWICENHGIVKEADIGAAAKAKAKQVGQYLHHAKSTGLI